MFDKSDREFDKGQEKISKHWQNIELILKHEHAGYLPLVGLLDLSISVKWLYVLERIRIGWHRIIATSLGYNPFVETIQPIIVTRRRTR